MAQERTPSAVPAWEVQFTEKFVSQLRKTPDRVYKALSRNHYERLANDPCGGRGIKRLQGWKEVYRLRVGDHRVVYRADRARQQVILWRVGPRHSIYRELGHDPCRDTPCVHIIADPRLRNLIEEQTVGANSDATGTEEQPSPRPELDPSKDRPLPPDFGRQLLQELGIVAGEDYETLLNCKTEDDLANCGIREAVLEAVLDALWPNSIVQSVDAPGRVADSAKGLEDMATGARDWASFLLALDDAQKPFVEKFTRRPSGPWMLKGGPGSGKSTMALYCIRNLLRRDQETLQFRAEPLRILFTTYTRALTTASEQLLDVLGVDRSRQEVEVVNVDKLAKHHATGSQLIYGARDDPWSEVVRAAILRESLHERTLGDPEFLHREMNDVIVGNEIDSLEKYKDFKRIGRRKLRTNQREQVWQFCVAAWQELQKRERCLPSHMFRQAGQTASPTYDYVFIDEAQDLTPVAIRMCIKLCKDPRNVFVTADRNQSVFSYGFSWKRVMEDLDFRGRSTILRRNYRTTHEIMRAIRPLLNADHAVDEDTRDDEPVRHGPRPELRYVPRAKEVETLKAWLKRTISEEGVGDSAVAVLCPTRKDCSRIVDALKGTRLASKAMTGEDFDLRFNGIKVTTMQGAKGLEFPIVAVVGLAADRMPWRIANAPQNPDETDKLRRTFFVACSRAARRLLVVADAQNPPPFVKAFDRTHWTVR